MPLRSDSVTRDRFDGSVACLNRRFSPIWGKDIRLGEDSVLGPKLLEEFDAEGTECIRYRQQDNRIDIRDDQEHKTDAAGYTAGDGYSYHDKQTEAKKE